MKKLILMLAFCASVSGAYAQKTVKVEKVQQSFYGGFVRRTYPDGDF